MMSCHLRALGFDVGSQLAIFAIMVKNLVKNKLRSGGVLQGGSNSIYGN